MSFYDSWEWKKVRYEALIKFGPKCMLCGSNDGIVVDHIIPVKVDITKSLDLKNLQILCNDCNMGKCQKEDNFVDEWSSEGKRIKSFENLAKVKNGIIYQIKKKKSFTAREHIVENGKTLCGIENTGSTFLTTFKLQMRVFLTCRKCKKRKEFESLATKNL